MIGCVIPRCNLNCGITQPILLTYLYIAPHNFPTLYTLPLQDVTEDLLRPYLHSGANVTYTRLAAASTEIRVSTIMRRCSRRLHRFIILSSDFGRSIDRLTEAALSGDIPGGARGHLPGQALLRRHRPLEQGRGVDAEVDKGRTDLGAVSFNRDRGVWQR